MVHCHKITGRHRDIVATGFLRFQFPKTNNFGIFEFVARQGWNSDPEGECEVEINRFEHFASDFDGCVLSIVRLVTVRLMFKYKYYKAQERKKKERKNGKFWRA